MQKKSIAGLLTGEKEIGEMVANGVIIMESKEEAVAMMRAKIKPRLAAEVMGLDEFARNTCYTRFLFDIGQEVITTLSWLGTVVCQAVDQRGVKYQVERGCSGPVVWLREEQLLAAAMLAAGPHDGVGEELAAHEPVTVALYLDLLVDTSDKEPWVGVPAETLWRDYQRFCVYCLNKPVEPQEVFGYWLAERGFAVLQPDWRQRLEERYMVMVKAWEVL